MTVNYVVNLIGAPLLAFYILKGSKMWENYIKLYRLKNMHGNAEKNLDDNLPLQVVAYLFLHIYSKEVF